MTIFFRRFVFVVCVAMMADSAAAQAAPPSNLALASLEDLLTLEVTSASRKEQRLGDVPSSVFVITQDDIRRSGMTSVAELLRLVPGVQVARLNSNKWAISVRGFNGLFSNKLLVLIDGRSVYDRLFSGVFWEVQDVLLDDVERIEVVRGPGGAIWGANAVNGVINIVTKTAADTQGVLIRTGGGTLDGLQAGIRYGATRGALAYRVFSQWSDHGESGGSSSAAEDGWRSSQSGFRADWTTGADAMTIEGSANFLLAHPLWQDASGPVPAVAPLVRDAARTQALSLLGRWTHTQASGASLQFQTFVDVSPRNDTTVQPFQTMADADAEYHTAIGRRHDIVAGGGYRFLHESVPPSYTLTITPNQVDEAVLNGFLQDQIAVSRRVDITVGARVERDIYTGWGVQPTTRAMWKVTPTHHLWSSVSRALRTPSLDDVTARLNVASFYTPTGLPALVALEGNPHYQAERVIDVEGGYRGQLGNASVDMTGFVGSYSGLQTNEPLTPTMEFTPAPAHLLLASQFANLLNATTSGVEIAAHWSPTARWRLDAGYSTFHLTPHLSGSSRDAAAAASDGNAPAHQWQARSSASLTKRLELDVLIFHAGRLVVADVPAYTRVDTRLAWQLSSRLSAALVGQNLSNGTHREYAGVTAVVATTELPRSVDLRFTWKL